MIEKPLISIIILNYNGKEFLENCIKSIKDQNYKNIEIILVDNNSSDNSHLECKEKFADIILIESKENTGYCGGNNIGIRQAHGQYVIILNPDTLMRSDSVEKLLESYKLHGNGLYQPKLLSLEDKTKINSGGNYIHLFGFGFSRGKGEKDNSNFGKFMEIPYASGACLFTEMKILNELDMFDVELFAYHDDLDLGWRASMKGYKSYFVPESIVYHAESFSFKWSKKKFYLLERNRWYCLLTHYSKSTLLKLALGLFISEIMIFFYYTKRGMIKEKFAVYSYLLKNRKKINERYHEIEKDKKIGDKILVKKFENTLQVPSQVANSIESKIFNSIISKIAKLSRIFL